MRLNRIRLTQSREESPDSLYSPVKTPNLRPAGRFLLLSIPHPGSCARTGSGLPTRTAAIAADTLGPLRRVMWVGLCVAGAQPPDQGGERRGARTASTMPTMTAAATPRRPATA